jgi:hypothetical protein
MWVSGRKYKKLVERVEALEKAVNMRGIAGGNIHAWPFYLDGLEEPSINEVVQELAHRSGITYDFGKKPGIVSDKK